MAYGTNDAGWNVSPAAFYDNYVVMIQAVLAAGKIPIVPRIPWGCTSNILANVPALNQKIDALYAAYPQIIRGPDLWAYFQANQSQISADCVHPSDQGYFGMRRLWADTMLASVYAAPSPSTLQLTSSTSTPTAGTSFSFTVTAQDRSGKTDPAYGGRVHFTSSDAAAGVVLPADSTLTNGQGTFSATLMTAGAQTITATDTVTAATTGTLSVTV
ncbi:MAG: SGNH/GDSL hydrolase family protein, partial [Chloroflexi bacterium]